MCCIWRKQVKIVLVTDGFAEILETPKAKAKLVRRRDTETLSVEPIRTSWR